MKSVFLFPAALRTVLLVAVLSMAGRVLAQCTANAGPATHTLCAGTSYNLNGSGTGQAPLSFSWTGSAYITNPNAQQATFNFPVPVLVDQVVNITLTVTDANGCTAQDMIAITVQATPEASLSIDPNDPLIVTTNFDGQTAFTLCGQGLPSYAFPFVDNSTPGASTYNVAWGAPPPSSSFAAAGWSQSHTYTTGLSTLTYTVTNGNQCADAASYFVFIGSNPSGGLINPGGTINVCTGEQLCIPIQGTAGNTPGTEYYVSFGDGLDTTFYQPAPAQICHAWALSSCDQPPYFTMHFDAVNPCSAFPTFSDVGPIVVSTTPVADFSILQGDTVCQGTPITFQNTSDAAEAPSCNAAKVAWTVTPASGYTTSSNLGGINGNTISTVGWVPNAAQNPVITFDQSGTYCIKLYTGNNSCGVDSITKCICVEAPPTPAFTISPGTGCVPLIGQTDNTSNSVNSCHTYYNWVVSFTGSICGSVGGYSFSGGTSAASFEPQITFSQAGNYQVQLQAINSCGSFPLNQNVSVAASPQASVYTVGPICAGQSIFPVGAYQPCGTPITGYSWTLTGGSPASSNTQSPGGVQYNTAGNFTVTTTATSACGPASASTPLVVNNVPGSVTASVVQDTVCAGGTIQLQAITIAGATYQWTGPNGFSSSQEDPSLVNISTLAQGTYSVTAYLGICAGPSSSVNVVVLPADQISIQPVSAICLGDSAHLIASGSSNYTWSTSGGLPVGTGANIWVHPAATTTYIVNSAANGSGCPGTQSVQVVVNQPTNVVTDANITVCDQAVPVQLNMSPSGGTWSDADLVNLNTATGVITPIPNSTGTDTLYYTYVNANNCISVAQTIVTINNEVAAVAGPDVSKCEGDPVFNLGGAPAGGTWTGNVTSFDPSTGGVFNLTYTYGSGSCQTSDAIVITVLDTPNVVVNSFALCANAQPIQLPDGAPTGGTWSGNVSGSGPWTFDPASGTSILTYTVSLNGCTGGDTALVSVTPPPVADPGIDTVLCDQSIAFPLVGNYGNAGTWTSTSPYFTNNPPRFTPVPGALGTWYATYTYTDAGGCSDADSVAITVGTTPQADAGVDNHVCQNGGTANYAGLPVNGSWQGSAYMSSSGVFDPAAAGSGPHDIIYCTGIGTCANCDTAIVTIDAPPNVTATSPLGFCDYEPMQDLVENPQGGTWSGSGGLTNTTQGLFDPGLAPLGANQLIYVWQDATTQCKDTAFVSITVNQEPVASFTHAAVACQYDGTFTFTADNTAGNITSWQWNFGDGSAPASGQVVQHAFQQVDTVTVTLVVGTGNCTDTTTSTVMVWPAPVANLALDTTSGCGPLTVQFTNSSTGPALSYAWSINNTIVSNNAAFGPYAFSAGVLTDTTYAIELDVTNQCGSASALDTVIVFSSPTAHFGPDFNGGCSPFTVHFANTSVGDADNYTWDWGDGSPASNSTAVIVAHTFTTGANDTTYTVTLTATNECGTDTHTYAILVHPNTITAFFNTDTTQGCAPLTVCYTQYSVGVTNWHWSFGYQNNTSNAQSPCFTYPEAGTFTATLFGDNGCSYDTVSVQITVWPSPPVSFTFAPEPVCGNIPVQFTNNTPDLAWCHWTFGDGDSSALTDPTHVFNTGSSYQVHLDAGWTQNTCTAGSSATVTVYAVPQAVPGPTDSVFCAPQVMAATNASTGSNLAYQWSLNGLGIGAGQLPPPQPITDPGTYTLQLIVIDQISGCRDTTSTTWVANPSPTSAFELQPVDPCGRPAWLDAVNNSTAGSFPEWWLDNAFISAQNVLHYALIGEGIHTLALVSTLPPGGCTDTARTQFELYALPVAAFTADTACTGHFIPLHDASIGAAQEWWYYNGTYVSTDPFTHAMVPHTIGMDTIALAVMSDHGCTDSTTRIVRVYPTSPSTFTPELVGDCQTVLLAPDTVMAHTSYQWTINNNWVSPDVRPTFYYDANTVANIPMMLVATTEDGCRDTTISYFPIPDCVNVPNSFTPDGDGLNEQFIPVILPPEHFEYLQVFDRWGEMIANITGTRTPAWDGTYGGEPVQVGVYVWRLKLTSRMDPYIGHVTVLR